MTKRRVTVTVDEALLEEANTAVRHGRAESVSAWVSEAMAEHHEREQRLVLLGGLINEYEDEHGVITDEELAEQRQLDRDAAATVRRNRRRACATTEPCGAGSKMPSSWADHQLPMGALSPRFGEVVPVARCGWPER